MHIISWRQVQEYLRKIFYVIPWIARQGRKEAAICMARYVLSNSGRRWNQWRWPAAETWWQVHTENERVSSTFNLILFKRNTWLSSMRRNRPKTGRMCVCTYVCMHLFMYLAITDCYKFLEQTTEIYSLFSCQNSKIKMCSPKAVSRTFHPQKAGRNKLLLCPGFHGHCVPGISVPVSASWNRSLIPPPVSASLAPGLVCALGSI